MYKNWETKVQLLYGPCEQLSILDLKTPNLLEVAGEHQSQTAEMLAFLNIETLV